MKILIVEDSATIRHAMCDYVSTAGHTPVVAENGEGALQILDQNDVDMVVMDVEMPGLDGFETTHLIREWFGDVWIPIIFVTGKAEESDLRQGIDAGGDDYLIKPVSETILLAKIRAMERITEMRNQLRHLNEELTILSERDGLTKLYNRRTFEARARDIWRSATRAREPLSVLIMDIDYFKDFNDCYGHLAGDECIAKVAEVISACLSRPEDIAARYGGEEFIALLPNTHEDGAYHVAERIRQAIGHLHIRHRESKCSNFVSISIGGAVVNHTSGTKFIDQLSAADKALYAAKKQGRNCTSVKLFNPKTVILVADSTDDIAHTIEGRLYSHCALLQARTGQEAVTMAITHRPDIIVLDHAIKGTPGLEAIKAIRRNADTSHTPLVLLSDYCQVEYENPEGDFAAEVCLSKPIAQDDLIDRLNELLF